MDAPEVFKKSKGIVLDHNLRDRKILTDTIRGWGLDVESFTRPKAALRHAGKNRCDIVLINASMLDLCGPELVQEFGKQVKIIAKTEGVDKRAAARALNLGAYDYVETPFRKYLLYHCISRALAVLRNERRSEVLMRSLASSRSEALESEGRLETLNRQLMERNMALSSLARNIEGEREEMESQIAFRLRNLLGPVIAALRSNEDLRENHAQLDMFAWHLEEVTTDLSMESSIALDLSAAELRIASLIKNGRNTEEIARKLNISENTVRSHRRNIRKKLKIGPPYSLRNYLLCRSRTTRQAKSDTAA